MTRVVRAGVLGTLSLLLATGAHVLGGGSLPGLGVLLVAAVLLGLLAALVTLRRCRFGWLAALLAAQQLGLHELFDLAGAARACTLGVRGAARAPHVGHAGALDAVTSCAPDGGMDMTSSAPGWLMVMAHVAAVLVTAWLLARGEAWLWRAVDRVAAAAGLRASHPTSPAPQDREPAGGDVPSRRLAYAVAAPRGPPFVGVR